jgi:aryl-alcohol dehydrogenase-like predicted oxidoreductase
VPRIPNNGNWECCTRVSIEKSIKFLKTNINTLFFHHPGDIHRVLNDEKILAKIKSDYNIKKIGFSIYTVSEKKLFSNFSFKPAAQYPLSIANLSFQRCNFGKGNNFIRSIFLQGLLLNKKFNKKKILSQRLVNSLKNFYSLLDFKKIDSLKLTLSYIAKLKNIDQILFGVDNITQLEKIINCELYNKIDYNLIKKINKLFYLNDTDPRNW